MTIKNLELTDTGTVYVTKVRVIQTATGRKLTSFMSLDFLVQLQFVLLSF